MVSRRSLPLRVIGDIIIDEWTIFPPPGQLLQCLNKVFACPPTMEKFQAIAQNTCIQGGSFLLYHSIGKVQYK